MTHEEHPSQPPLCVHCGRQHDAQGRRCPETGRALGGDERLIGQLIDKRYRIVRLLGEGPFGAVYKAEHVNVGRHVALRLLPLSLVAHPAVLHRFFREARLMSSVECPRIQPLLDAGLSSEGYAYVAYQYVRGRSVAAALSVDAPLPIPVAATIVCDVLEGLAAIHESGFVHRAVAPESVLLQQSAAHVERAMLTNLGAAALGADARKPESLGEVREQASLPRVVVPAIYEPPERRKGAPADRREDIYGAGVLLAACLSPNGRPLFGSDLHAAGISPSLEAIVARAVHPSPGARFHGASEMRALLLSYAALAEEDVASVTKTAISDLRTLSRRERLHAGLPTRARLVGTPTDSKILVDGPLAVAVIRAIERTAAIRWPEFGRRVPLLLEALAEAKNKGAPLARLVLAAALEEADALFGMNDRLFCTVVGERAAKDELVEAMLKTTGPITPELYFDQVVRDLVTRLGEPMSRVSYVGRGYGRLELRAQPEPNLALCACTTGIIRETLTRLGARQVEVNKTACVGVGDPMCIFTGTWA